MFSANLGKKRMPLAQRRRKSSLTTTTKSSSKEPLPRPKPPLVNWRRLVSALRHRLMRESVDAGTNEDPTRYSYTEEDVTAALRSQRVPDKKLEAAVHWCVQEGWLRRARGGRFQLTEKAVSEFLEHVRARS